MSLEVDQVSMFKFVAKHTALVGILASCSPFGPNAGPTEISAAVDAGPASVRDYLLESRSQEELDAALEYSARRQDVVVLRLLVDAGADPLHQDKSEGLLSSLASSHIDNLEAAEYLLSVGADPCDTSEIENEITSVFSEIATNAGQPMIAALLAEIEQACP